MGPRLGGCHPGVEHLLAERRNNEYNDNHTTCLLYTSIDGAPPVLCVVAAAYTYTVDDLLFLIVGIQAVALLVGLDDGKETVPVLRHGIDDRRVVARCV